MNKSKFFLNILVPAANWNYQVKPKNELIKYYVNEKPIIGISDDTFEFYQKVDYTTFLELRKHFPHDYDYYYQAVRFIGQPDFKIQEVPGVYITIEKTVDQTIIHLVSEPKFHDKLDLLLTDIKTRYADYYIGSIHQTIEGKLLELLYQKGLTISFGESCTGGMLSSRLINCKGASAVITRSFVTYSNNSKSDILGVEPKLIKRHGVVSAEVAEVMVEGLAKISKADVNVTVTGYAGGDDPNPDDGLCYFAFRYQDFINIERLHFNGDRNQVRTQVTSYILYRVGQLLTVKP